MSGQAHALRNFARDQELWAPWTRLGYQCASRAGQVVVARCVSRSSRSAKRWDLRACLARLAILQLDIGTPAPRAE
eukprot:15482002-Alexandrium_andersonii.AAC.1